MNQSGLELVVMGVIVLPVGIFTLIFTKPLRKYMIDMQARMYGRVGEAAGNRLAPWMLVAVGVAVLVFGVLAMLAGLLRELDVI